VEVLANELGPRGVAVNSILPTAIDGAGVFTEGAGLGALLGEAGIGLGVLLIFVLGNPTTWTTVRREVAQVSPPAKQMRSAISPDLAVVGRLLVSLQTDRYRSIERHISIVEISRRTSSTSMSAIRNASSRPINPTSSS